MADRFAVGHDQLPVGGAVLPSAARTTDTNSDDIGNLGGAGVVVVIDMTEGEAVDTVTFHIQGKDDASGKYYTILSSTALNAVATTVLQVHPALTVVAFSAASHLMPETWRVQADHSGVGSFTYSVGAVLTV